MAEGGIRRQKRCEEDKGALEGRRSVEKGENLKKNYMG